jgi:hypothetical protein
MLKSYSKHHLLVIPNAIRQLVTLAATALRRLLDASIERSALSPTADNLKRRPHRSNLKIAVSCFLFAIYVWGILGDVVVTAVHAIDHLLAQTVSAQAGDHHHGVGNHSHGQILDHALASVGKGESRDAAPTSPPPLRLSRCFEHLFQPIISFHDLQITNSQIWLFETSTLSELSQEPLIPPPEIA